MISVQQSFISTLMLSIIYPINCTLKFLLIHVSCSLDNLIHINRHWFLLCQNPLTGKALKLVKLHKMTSDDGNITLCTICMYVRDRQLQWIKRLILDDELN